MAKMKTVHKIASYAIAINIFLFIFKLVMALFSGSISLLADAIHSSTDVISSVALFIGIRIAGRKTKRFPLGLYKVENLISLGIAFIIFLTGYEMIREVFFQHKILTLTRPYYAMATACIAMMVTWLFSAYEMKIGRQENSPAILADSRHIRTDAIVSFIVLLGLIGKQLQFPAEKIATVVVIVFIIKSGWDILLESVRVLLDASIDPNTLSQIREIISRHSAITEIREILGRNSGSYTFIEGDLVVRAKDFSHAHQIIEEITTEIRREIPHIDRIVLHYEPAKRTHFLIAAMLKNASAWHISEHFGEAPFIGWVEIHTEENCISRMQITANPFLHIERGKGIKVAEHLTKHGVDVVLVRQPFHGKGPEYVFSSHDVKVLTSKEKIIEPGIIARIYKEETGHTLLAPGVQEQTSGNPVPVTEHE
jgi:cation diffusion facilitator family transporter